MTWRDLAAGGVAVALMFFAVSDGAAGHAPVQAVLIAAGGLLVFEVVAELLEALIPGGRARRRP